MRSAFPPLNRNLLNVTLVQGAEYSPDRPALPAGHCLSRIRLRHLRQSDWVVVSDESVLLGLAAYKKANSDVRVIHEVLVDRTLSISEVARITDMLISALEMTALDEGVNFLMFMLDTEVLATRFESYGYDVIVADRCGTWIQKKLDGFTWPRRSRRPPQLVN
jgi:hypothetical protein